MSGQSSPSLVVHAAGPAPTAWQLLGEVGDVVKSVPIFLTAPLYRRWHQRWGATDAEVAAVMPGDHMVPECQYVITRAITIDAPRDLVWPWLAQVGFGKAGFYANDLLDNAGHRSAEHILPDLQEPKIGDCVPMFTKVNDTTAFQIEALERNNYLLWVKPDSTWVWMLTPTANGGTRLVTRLRILYRWRSPGEALFSILLNEVGDFAMMRRMLLGIRKRAERLAAAERAMAKLTRDIPSLVAAAKS
jgi:hypothetical protein